MPLRLQLSGVLRCMGRSDGKRSGLSQYQTPCSPFSGLRRSAGRLPDTMAKTIKEIAEEIGVSKQAVFKKIKREPLSTSLQGLTTTVDGRLMVEADGEKLIKQAFFEIDRQPKRQPVDGEVDGQLTATVDGQTPQNHINEAVCDTVIDMLRKELEIKNEQIRELNTRLGEVTSALVAAQQTAQAAQALHAGTMHQQIDRMPPNKRNAPQMEAALDDASIAG